MAFSFKVGSFTSSGSSGAQAVTGVGFQPKALILLTTSQVSGGLDTFAVFGIGAASSTSDQGFSETRSNHGASAGDAACANATGNIYHRETFGGSLVGPSGTITAIGGDGFTVTWSVGHTAFPITYIALAGDDLTNVDLAPYTVPGSATSQAYTGVGFQPDAMILFGGSAGAVASTTDPLGLFIGFTDGTNQAVMCWAADEGADPTNSVSLMRDDRIAATLNGSGSAIYNQASLVSLDTDGFTLNWDTRTASHTFYALCLKGGSYKVGKDSFKTSTGTQQTTTGFTPAGVIILSNGGTDSASVLSGVRTTIGAGDGTTMRVVAYVDQDNVASVVARRFHDSGDVLNLRSDDGTSAVVVADVDSFDADTGFTLNFTTADGATREFIYFAAGSIASGGEIDVSASSPLTVTSTATRNADYNNREASNTLELTDAAVRQVDDEFLVKVGSFQTATSTGPQNVTGLGFQPRAIIFFNALDEPSALNGSAATWGWFGFGAAGLAGQAAIAFNAIEGGVSESASVEQRTDACILTVPHTSVGNPLLKGELTAFGADGFTIDWDFVPASARVVNYLAIGGGVLEEANVSAYQVPATTGPESYTGLGFQPDAMILFAASHGTLDSRRNADPLSLSIGFSDGGRQAVSSFGVDQFSNPTDNYRYQRTNRILATINGETNALHNEASLTSLDADGFTLDFQSRNASDYFFALCLKGGRYRVGSDTQNTSLGNKATTGIPFTPGAVLFQTFGQTASSVLNANIRHSVGASDGLANVSNLVVSNDNQFLGPLNRHITSDIACLMANGLSAYPTLFSFDNDGFTLDWDATDGTAREFLFLAIGAPPDRAEAESELILDQDVGLNVEWNAPAVSELTLVSEAVASGPKTGVATSVLELVDQAYNPIAKTAAAASLLELLSRADSNSKFADAVSLLELVTLGDHSVKQRVAASILEFLDTATAVASKKAKSVITLTQEADRFLRAGAVSSLLTLTQQATVPLQGRSQLSLVSVAEFVPPSATKLARSTLSLSQIATVMKDLGLSVVSTLSLAHAVAVILSRPSFCQYDPEGLPALDSPDDPSFTKGIRLAAGMDTITIERSMNLGDIDRLAFDRIYRETRGGTLVVFANPIWPKIETLVFSVSTVKRTQAQAVLTFLRTYLGQDITLTTHEGRQWSGVVMNPQSAVVEDRPNSFTINIEFEGTEVT